MKFSKKCRYGVIALIDLAMHSRDTHVSLGSIAERNQISPQYLEQVFASLRRARIVRSSQGGYLLNYPADKITVSQIVEALEGSYHLESETGNWEGTASIVTETIQKDIVDRVNDRLDQILQNLTLADLEQDCMQREQDEENMYYI